MAAAVGLSAYWSALASRPDEPTEPAVPRPVPGLVPLVGGRPSQPEAAITARDRAYVRGRNEGIQEGRRAALRRLGRDYRRGGRGWSRIYRRGRLAALGFADWSAGAAYVVTLAPDGRGIAARTGPLTRGARYGFCRNGKRICVTPPG